MKILSTLLASAALLSAPAAFAQASAASYPTKAVKIIVPFAPGGPTDHIARLMAEKLGARLGQSFYVENRLGAGGVVGADAALRSEPDGHTLLVASVSYAVNPALMKMTFDPIKDAEPVVNLMVGTTVFLANAKAPFNTLPEMIAYAKANPDKLSYGTQGVGSVTHVATEAFLADQKIKIAHIPYKGIGPALTALAAGEVDLSLPDLGASQALITAGKVKVLAIAGNKRVSQLPQIPAAPEVGIKMASSGSWQGMFAPRGTPKAVVDKLNHEINEILKSKEVVDILTARFAVPVGGTSAEFAAQVKSDIQRYSEVVRSANIKAE